MSIVPYTRCTWEGCGNAALPGCPQGAEFCINHIDQATARIDAMTARLTGTVTPLWHKPGRWVPVVLFIIWTVLTFAQPEMIFWWVIFVPVAWFGHHWGMGNGRSSQQPQQQTVYRANNMVDQNNQNMFGQMNWTLDQTPSPQQQGYPAGGGFAGSAGDAFRHMETLQAQRERWIRANGPLG